jgi:hypothetical protein
MELSDSREIGKVRKGEKNMLNTKFSEEELTSICQILKRHGTDCATLVDILKLANMAASNDCIATYKHAILMKEFGILKDRDLICHVCVMEVINHHADTCEEYKEKLHSNAFNLCPNDHYDYSKCEPAVWMVDGFKVIQAKNNAAETDWAEGRRDNIILERGGPIYKEQVIVGYEKDKRRFNFVGREDWLKKTFPDISTDIRHNPWMGFLCEKHIGSMRSYANKIMDYRKE